MTPPPTGKQKPACEQCRRRKLRCDGKKPRCSTCEHAGTECDINTQRVPRGPKKGYLAALQNKVATLESRLLAQKQEQQSLSNGVDALLPPTPTVELENPPPEQGFVADLSWATPPFSETDLMPNGLFNVSPMPAATTATLAARPAPTTAYHQRNMNVTDPMHAELDQTFFDRMHASVPILHRRRYLSWSKSPIKTRSQECLQHAVWATASLMSAHFQHLQDFFYPELKQMLVNTYLTPTHNSPQLEVDVELAQAWILTATYEFAKSYFHEACISAGRAFRLVQLMRLHQIDDAPSNGAPMGANGTDFVILEERRRAFWMAFTLESLYSMRNHLPLLVNEYAISTFLPVPDHQFQNRQETPTGTLNDCIAKGSQAVKSPLNECILLIATCARTLRHLQQSDEQHRGGYDHSQRYEVEQQQLLNDGLALRLQTLKQDYPSPNDSSDPMLLFANFLAQACVIYVWRESRSPGILGHGAPVDRGGAQSTLAEYQQRAYVAVERIFELAQSVTDLPFAMIHPFTPIPLFLCVQFFSLVDGKLMDQNLLNSLVEITRQLTDVHSMQHDYIEFQDSRRNG